MISLYELKQNACFRCFYKANFIIKNVFLLCVLTVLIFLTYIIYFRPDGGSIRVAVNILKGLNSNTFNHLQGHSLENLHVQSNLTLEFQTSKYKVESMDFFTRCVRVNRPCLMLDQASEWPAVTKWDSTRPNVQAPPSQLGPDGNMNIPMEQ